MGWITSNGTPNKNKVSRILGLLKLPTEGLELIEKEIVTDVITLELLRKINDEDSKLFKSICKKIVEAGGIQRKKVESIYKVLKEPKLEEVIEEAPEPKKNETSLFENSKGVLQFKKIVKPNGKINFELEDVSKAKANKIFKFIKETLNANVEV